MRVGLFTNNYLPFRGGVATAVETLRQGLEALGHRTWIFAPAAQVPQADPPHVFRYPSIPAPTYPGFSLPLPISRRLGRIARALELDVVHVHHPFLLGLTGRRLARSQRRPLVFTYHTRYEKYAHYVPLPPRLVRSLAVRLACRFADSADLVVAPSEHVANTLRRRGVGAPVTVTCPAGAFPKACAVHVPGGDDLAIDLVEAQIHGIGDLPTLDRLEGCRQRDFRAQCGDVGGAGPGHHVLQQDAIGNAARQWADVIVGVEIERRVFWVAAIGRLEADETCR